MFAVGVISFLAYLIATGLFGVIIENDADGFPLGAWLFGALIFVVVVLAWADGLPFPLKR